MRVLIVEDDEIFRFALERMLAAHGHECQSVESGLAARRAARLQRYDVALIDLRLPDEDGVVLTRDLAQASTRTPVVCLTGCERPESVVAAMRAGASDYLVKPIPAEQLVSALESARRGADAQPEADLPRRPLGESPVWLDVLDLAERVAAASRAKVLLTGESGTGKDVVARYIHARSERREQPCIVVNCACLGNELVEAELFGHEAGAFTGARTRRRGVLELADKGTLFLDEIGELPLPMQAKLLRVLEEKKFRRVGGEQEINVDVRFVFATNQPLRERSRTGLFRWDLYQRIAVFELALPPLRDRPGDVRHLCEGLLPAIADGLGVPTPRFATSAWPELTRHAWPGNVRELRNVLERAVVMSAGEIDASLVRRLIAQPSGERAVCMAAATAPCPLEHGAPTDLETAIRNHCQRALAYHAGNLSAAARHLGISRGALRRHLNRPGSNDEDHVD